VFNPIFARFASDMEAGRQGQRQKPRRGAAKVAAA
jgi:hypothetical protein